MLTGPLEAVTCIWNSSWSLGLADVLEVKTDWPWVRFLTCLVKLIKPVWTVGTNTEQLADCEVLVAVTV